MTTERLIEKLRKIKASAEGEAKIGNEAAAQAFAEMLNKLLMDNKLEMTDIEFEQMEAEQPVDRHRVDYERHGIKVKRQRSAWMEKLAGVLAHAHFCRFLVHTGSSRITFVGRKDDCEVVEYMFVTLLKATETLADNAYDEIVNIVLKECGICKGPKAGHAETHPGHGFVPNYLRARGYRPAFIDAFINRLSHRFYELRQARQGETTALVRINKAEAAVQEWMNRKDGRRKLIKSAGALRPGHAFNNEGRAKGREAADKINLHANAIKSGNPVRGALR